MVSSNAKAALVVGGMFVMICMTLVPAVLHPRLNPGYYSKTLLAYHDLSVIPPCGVWIGKKQKWIRDKVPLEETQPGGMLHIVLVVTLVSQVLPSLKNIE